MPEPLLISDGRSMGLVDERARLAWLCAPRVDQPAVCAALLDPDRGGAVEVLLEDAEPAGQRHQEGTLVVETDLRTPTGLVRVVDVLFIPPRGPVAAAEPGILIRQMIVMEGTVRLGVRVDPRYGFGRDVPRWLREGRATRGHGPGLTVELQCELPVRPAGVGLAGAAELPAGQRRTLALRWQDPKGVGTDLRKMAEDTAAWWRAWSARGNGDPRAPVLKGLVYHPTGALVRSATTSLADPPEDGRLCWLEDQRAAAAAFREMGHAAEAERLEAWLERAGGGGPVRGLGAEEPPPATTVTHLARPVAVGRPEGDARGNVPYVPDLLAG